MKHDALSGLPTHHHVPFYLKNSEDMRIGVFFDIDGFAWMNYYFGVAISDEVLVRVALTIDRLASDSASRAFRVGGDEFLALLPVSTSPADAMKFAHHVVRGVRELQIDYQRRDNPTRQHLALNAVVGPVTVALTPRISAVRDWIADEIWRAKNGERHRIEVVAELDGSVPQWSREP